MTLSRLHSAIVGLAVGDALGVPVEFLSRADLKENPVTDMMGYGTHNQPAGTWSDDSSLTLCLAETLADEYNLKKLSNRFINWYEYAYWTAHGNVFDVGIATSKAINKLEQGVNPIFAGGTDEADNGNGSLMRILPLAFYVKDMPIEARFKCVSDVSSLTHAHIRSILGCFIYIEYALQLIDGKDKFEAFQQTKEIVNSFLNNNPICCDNEINKYHRILMNPIGDYEIKPVYEYSESEISSSGYVVSSLEAALWCLFKEKDYKSTVLRAVNLGNDTDTIAAIAGGLAGILYGYKSIPQQWIDQIARKDDILNLCDRLDLKLKKMKEIKYLKGDATSPQAGGIKIIAHISNDIGGWGKGFVLAISKRWAEPEKAYREWHRNRAKNDFELGAVQIVQVEEYIYVANMVGQRGTKVGRSSGVPIRYEAVEECLKKLADEARILRASIHMPRIGCGLAAGKWEKIEPLILKTLSENDIEVYVYDFD